MNKILKELFTGSDNETQELLHWLTAFAFLVGIGLTVFAVIWKSQVFNLQEFGLGTGAMAAAHGMAKKMIGRDDATQEK